MLDRRRPARGRPKKFGRPSRAVTVTLPEDVLARLTAVDADLARAIVRLAERTRPEARTRVPPPAELVAYGSHAVIVLNPVRALTRLRGVQLVPVGNGRALISLDRLASIAQLELDIGDVLERDRISAAERRTLEAIAGILRRARHSHEVSLEERSIIVVERKRARRK